MWPTEEVPFGVPGLLPCSPICHRCNTFPAAPRPLRLSAPGRWCIPGPSPHWGRHRPPGLFWFGSCGEEWKVYTLRNPAGESWAHCDPSLLLCPRHLRAYPHALYHVLNLGVYRPSLCLIWGSPGKANFLLSLLPLPGGRPSRTLCRPQSRLENTAVASPGVLSSEEVPQARPPVCFPRVGKETGPYMTPGFQHWWLVS